MLLLTTDTASTIDNISYVHSRHIPSHYTSDLECNGLNMADSEISFYIIIQ